MLRSPAGAAPGLPTPSWADALRRRPPLPPPSVTRRADGDSRPPPRRGSPIYYIASRCVATCDGHTALDTHTHTHTFAYTFGDMQCTRCPVCIGCNVCCLQQSTPYRVNAMHAPHAPHALPAPHAPYALHAPHARYTLHSLCHYARKGSLSRTCTYRTCRMRVVVSYPRAHVRVHACATVEILSRVTQNSSHPTVCATILQRAQPATASCRRKVLHFVVETNLYPHLQ